MNTAITFGWRGSLSRVLGAIPLLAMVVALPSGAQVSNAGQFPTGTGQSTQHTARSAPTVDMDQPIGGSPGMPVYMERRLRQPMRFSTSRWWTIPTSC